MTVYEFVKEASKRLREANIEAPEFEAKQIAEFVFGKIHTKEILDRQCLKAEQILLRRLSHEPLQYIFGEWEFYGLPFKVGNGVLIPRPDTEIVIDVAIGLLKDRLNPKIYDLCSGSGCIGITLAKKMKSNVTLIEKSEDAFEFLEQNINLNAVNVEAIMADVLENPNSKFNATADMIVCNPPYIKSEVIPSLSKEVSLEPVLALDGGIDGLDFYRFIAKCWKKVLKQNGYLLFEIGYDQREQVEEILKQEGFDEIKTVKDYGGNDRAVYGKKVN